MTTVNIHEAKTQLSALIQKALNGEKVVIAKNNNPVVTLSPIIKSTGKRKPGLLKGKISYIGSWDDGDKEIEDLFLNSKLFPDE